MKITFLGAAQTVTGSRILFEHNHFKGLIDCGLFQGPKDLREKNWLNQEELIEAQCVILTHVHIDHSGYLPRLYKKGFRKPIYCSKPSADLLPVMLLDAAKLQEEDAMFANRIKHSHYDPALPLYETKDALGCKDLVYSVGWDSWKTLSDSLSFRFLRSGHILGSACVQLAYSENNKSKILTFTGDLGGSGTVLMRDPDKISESDYIVTESTYGDRRLVRENLSHQLAEVINKVYSRKGTLIVPAFSVGRTQDLLLLISNLKRQNAIPEQVPVYMDSPMSHKITEIYLRHQEELKPGLDAHAIEHALGSAVCRPVMSADESMLLCMSDEPKIVISASGMLQGGRVLHHLKSKLPDEKSGVLFVGFQTQGSKGRLLKNGLNKIRIHHREVDVEAEIFSIDGFSAHADSNELIAWLSNIKTAPHKTIINHGEKESSEALAYRIRHELGWDQVLIPAMGDTISLEE